MSSSFELDKINEVEVPIYDENPSKNVENCPVLDNPSNSRSLPFF